MRDCHESLIIFNGEVEMLPVYQCDASCPNLQCMELAFEAWERMTFGGIQVDRAVRG